MIDTTTAHTAGPWELMYPDNPFDGFVAGPDDKLVAIGMGDDTRANARLIAAAPDLLAALEDMVHLFDHPGIYGLITQGKRHGWTAENVVERIGASRRAKAAIAKAKGA